MARNVFDDSVDTNLRKNLFDLSEQCYFSSSAGLLVPSLVRDVVPGDKFKISLNSFVRTSAVNTAAFSRLREYVHFFFVPYRQLWQDWPRFINGVDYKPNPLLGDNVPDSVPVLNLFKAFNVLYSAGYFREAFAELTISGKKLEEVVLDEGYLGQHRPNTRLVPVDEVIPVASYQSSAKAKDKHGYSRLYSFSRLMDMLGYGCSFGESMTTSAGKFEDALSAYDKSVSSFADLFGISVDLTKSTSSVQVGSVDARNASDGAIESSIKGIRSISGASAMFVVNPFRILAYHKIYQDFYRRNDIEKYNPSMFSLDALAKLFAKVNLSSDTRPTANISDADVSLLADILCINYRPLPKDYFVGVTPSVLDDIGTVSGSAQVAELYGSLPVSPSDTSNVKDGTVSDDGTLSAGTGASNTTRGVRLMFALEKLLRKTKRAGSGNYSDQLRAHYGVSPYLADTVDYLGGYTNVISINEVVTTASTSSAQVGDLGGKGLSQGADGFVKDFEAKEHGLIMAITSVVPEMEYNSTGLDRFNAKVRRGDYFHPEFDELGMQPTFGYELENAFELKQAALLFVDKPNSATPGDISRVVVDQGYMLMRSASANTVLGYAPAYMEYKAAVDKVHGEFRRGRSLSPFVNRNTLRISSSGFDKSSLFTNPGVLNSVFAQAYDGREITDQFIISHGYSIKAIRPMSVLGEKL